MWEGWCEVRLYGADGDTCCVGGQDGVDGDGYCDAFADGQDGPCGCAYCDVYGDGYAVTLYGEPTCGCT